MPFHSTVKTREHEDPNPFRVLPQLGIRLKHCLLGVAKLPFWHLYFSLVNEEVQLLGTNQNTADATVQFLINMNRTGGSYVFNSVSVPG